MNLTAEIQDKACELAALIAAIPATPRKVEFMPAAGTVDAVLYRIDNNPGANVTLALRHLEDCVFRATKAIDSNDP